MKITKESPDEHVVVNESNTLAEELLSDNQASVEEYSSEVTDSDDSSESNKIDVTQQVSVWGGGGGVGAVVKLCVITLAFKQNKLSVFELSVIKLFSHVVLSASYIPCLTFSDLHSLSYIHRIGKYYSPKPHLFRGRSPRKISGYST